MLLGEDVDNGLPGKVAGVVGLLGEVAGVVGLLGEVAGVVGLLGKVAGVVGLETGVVVGEGIAGVWRVLEPVVSVVGTRVEGELSPGEETSVVKVGDGTGVEEGVVRVVGDDTEVGDSGVPGADDVADESGEGMMIVGVRVGRGVD